MIRRIDKKDKIEINVFSLIHLWPIGVVLIFCFILLYNIYSHISVITFLIIGIALILLLSYLVINFFVSKTIVLDKKLKKLRIRFWNISLSEIKQIHSGSIRTISFPSFSFNNIFFELKDKYIAYPGRFSPSIKGESDKIIRIIQKEIKK